MNSEPELEASPSTQVSSSAQNNRSGEKEPAVLESGAQPGQLSQSGPYLETSKGDDRKETSAERRAVTGGTTGGRPSLGGAEQGAQPMVVERGRRDDESEVDIGGANSQGAHSLRRRIDGTAESLEPDNAGVSFQGAQQAVIEPDIVQGRMGAQEPGGGGATSQGAQSSWGRISLGAQPDVTKLGRNDYGTEDPTTQLGADIEASSQLPAIDEDRQPEHIEKNLGAHSKRRVHPENSVVGRNQDDTLASNKGRNENDGGAHSQTRKEEMEGAQPLRGRTRSREDGKSNKQPAQVIPLIPDYSEARASQTNEQDPRWLKLKALLPEASTAWWNVRINDGLILKLRWREADGQNPTLTFPRLLGEQLDRLNDLGDDDAKRTIREWIAGYLYDLTLNQDKRDKALIAAEKLAISLDDQRAIEDQ
jgi:hypothetical protein